MMSQIPQYEFTAPVPVVPGAVSPDISDAPLFNGGSGAVSAAPSSFYGDFTSPSGDITFPVTWSFSDPVRLPPLSSTLRSAYAANHPENLITTLQSRLVTLWRYIKPAPDHIPPPKDTEYEGDTDESDTSVNDVGDEDFESDSLESEEEVGSDPGPEEEKRNLSNMLLTLQDITEQVKLLKQENKKLQSTVETLECKNVEFLRRCENNPINHQTKLRQKNLSVQISKLIKVRIITLIIINISIFTLSSLPSCQSLPLMMRLQKFRDYCTEFMRSVSCNCKLVSFFAKSFNKLSKDYIQVRRLNINLGASYFKSFSSSLLSRPLRETLYHY